MSLLIGFLTFILVVDCLLLMLLILIQLPKKEAGAGIAFGGAATDALFGAGSGNALTRMTRYTATMFLILAFSLSLLNSREAQSGRRRFEQELRKKMNAPAAFIPPGGPNSNAPEQVATSTQTVQSLPPLAATNLTIAATTNQIVPLASTNVAAAIQTQAIASPKPAVTNQPAAITKSAITNQAATNSPSPAPKP